MDAPEGMNRAERAGWRFGMERPRETVALVTLLFSGTAVAAIVGAAMWWDEASVPVLGLIAGVAIGTALNVLAWWAWRRGYDLSPVVALPFWVLPVAAMFAAIAPRTVPSWAPMIAYGFAVAFLIGGAILAVVGLRERERLGDERANEQAARAWHWMHGG